MDGRKFAQGLAALAILLVTLTMASPARAGCNDCRYVDRGDRFEGSTDPPVSGASIALVAVHYKPVPSRAVSAAEQLHLWFWLPAAGVPSITVQEKAHSYLMRPKAKHLKAGLQEFAWSRKEVIKPLQIEIASLYLKVSDRDETVYYPAFLSAGSSPAAGGGYEFLFESGAGLEATCKITRDDQGATEDVRDLTCSRDFGGTLSLTWDGRDNQGKPAPAGLYTLRIRGELLAETPRPVRKTFSFVHYGQLD